MPRRYRGWAEWEESVYSLPIYHCYGSDSEALMNLTRSLQRGGHFRLLDIQNLKKILEITFELGKAEERKRHIE